MRAHTWDQHTADFCSGSRAELDRGMYLHPLKGERKGDWAMTVSSNWRITFRFVGEDATDLNLEDYH